MGCTLQDTVVNEAVKFHGHRCPGLMIGIRAAELAIREFPKTTPPDLTAIVETDSCGVDAIQSVLSCTFGKGNLIHNDLGKMAFSFFDRSKNSGIRAILKKNASGDSGAILSLLMKKKLHGSTDENEKIQIAELKKNIEKKYMALSLEEMFEVKVLGQMPPRHARILESLECADCGEMFMESRARLLMGKTLCITCFEKLDAKF